MTEILKELSKDSPMSYLRFEAGVSKYICDAVDVDTALLSGCLLGA
jgi:hypothetical protein